MARLLWITERFPPDMGGVARSAGRMVRSLTTQEITVDVVTWSRYLQGGETLPPEASPTQDPNLRVHRLGLYRHWDMTLPHTLNLLDWLHQQQSYDAVWGHYLSPAGFVAVWFGQLKGLPSIVNARGNDIDRGLFPPGDFARLQWTLANASQITAVSQDMATKVETLCQRPVIVLPNVVDTSLFQPNRFLLENVQMEPPIHLDDGNRNGLKPSQPLIQNNSTPKALKDTLGIQPGEIVLGFSGELREKKGQRFLLEALIEVCVVRPACLLIIGELRSESQMLLQHYSTSNPTEMSRVIVTGHLDSPTQVAEHLRLCDVYLQPSLWEGMPNGLLEAMACGCACIGSDAGGIPEVIDHGITGFVLPRAQLHHLGKAILEYLALEPLEQQTLRLKGYNHIVQSHCLSQEQSRLKQLVNDLLSGGTQ